MMGKFEIHFTCGSVYRTGEGPGVRGRAKVIKGCVRVPTEGYYAVEGLTGVYAPTNPVKVVKPKGIMYTQLANGSLVKDGPALVAEPQGYIKIAAEAKFGKGVNTIKVKKGDWIRLEKTA